MRLRALNPPNLSQEERHVDPTARTVVAEHAAALPPLRRHTSGKSLAGSKAFPLARRRSSFGGLLGVATYYPIEVAQTTYEPADVYSLSSSPYNLWGKDHSSLAKCTIGGASWMPEGGAVFVQRLNGIQGFGAHHISLFVDGVP